MNASGPSKAEANGDLSRGKSGGSDEAKSQKGIRVGWLIDGQGGPALPDVNIVLRDSHIAKVAPAAELSDADIDLSHATVLPILMDAHVHLTLSGTLNPQIRQTQLTPTAQQAQATIDHNLGQHWQYGVAAVRHAGDRHGYVLRCKQQKAMAGGLPMHVAATGWAWHALGRYGGMLGQAPPEGQSLAEAMAHGSDDMDHIKVILSGMNSLNRFGRQTEPQFSSRELNAAVGIAIQRGLPLMVHANGEKAVAMALAAGCDSIEHGYFMGAENLRQLADESVAWVPTAVPMDVLAQNPALTRSQKDVARRTLDHQMALMASAHRMGVHMVLGTDAGSQGVDHGRSVWQELGLMVEAGLPLEQAIRCATFNAARLLGFNDRGALVPGWRADFIAVAGSPETLLKGPAVIEALCITGRWWDRNGNRLEQH